MTIEINTRAKPKDVPVQVAPVAEAAKQLTPADSPFKVGGIYTCNDGRKARIDGVKVVDGVPYFFGKVTYHHGGVGDGAWPFSRHWTMSGVYAGGAFLTAPDGNENSPTSLVPPAQQVDVVLNPIDVLEYWKKGGQLEYKAKSLHEKNQEGVWFKFASFATAKGIFLKEDVTTQYLLNYSGLYVFRKV